MRTSSGLAALTVLFVVSVPGAATLQSRPDKESARSRERAKLHRRAESILDRHQKLELTTREARGKVQLLMKDLKAWADAYDIELEPRSRTFGSPPKRNKDELLTADHCPLFYEETLKELCLLDFEASEVWGASVVFCRFLCAP